MKTLNKFLEFNGKAIYFLAKDGQYWIAIKPICEALNIEYTRQFKNLKSDQILGAALAVQPMQVGTEQVRNYTCLPEFFVYGWIFSIQSASKELQNYKWQCYKILYEYFRGSIGGRKDILMKRTDVTVRKEQLRNALMEDERFKELKELERLDKELGKELRENDELLIAEQLALFTS